MEDVPSHDPDDQNPAAAAAAGHSSSVDSSRPFRSVKEAVAIFGERFLAGELYAPKPFAFPKQEIPFFAPTTPQLDRSSEPPPLKPSGAAAAVLADTVKKLETELQETKAEMKLLKDRESETEVAVASLNAELHRNMSKLAQAEADAAAKAAAASSMALVGGNRRRASPSLAQVLSVGEDKLSLLVGRKKERREKMKKKPIIPLLGDLFSKRKGSSSSSSTLHNPLYASSHLQL